MTIALIGNEGTTRAAALVALVSSHGSDDFVAAIERAGQEVLTCSSWDELREHVRTSKVDLVVCDEQAADGAPDDCPVPTVCVSADVEADALQSLCSLAAGFAGQAARLASLEAVVEGIRSGDAIVGSTPVMRRLNSAVSRAADCDATVLIEGPAGSGKSLAARAIHLKSRRCDQQMVIRDAATLSGDELAQLIDDCSTTTLVIESVDELPTSAQAVLVKHLKERASSRAPSLVRLITTSSAHIPELVARGTFREDLFYRLHAFPVLVPSLAERVDDVVLIAEAILDAGVPPSGSNHHGLTPAARMLLESMQWPGNVAQLEATVRRGQMLAGGAPIDRDHLLAPVAASPGSAVPASTTGNASAEEVELTEEMIRPFEDEEKHLLGRALRATKGNVRRAAQLLGIGRATLYRKIQQYDLRLH